MSSRAIRRCTGRRRRSPGSYAASARSGAGFPPTRSPTSGSCCTTPRRAVEPAFEGSGRRDYRTLISNTSPACVDASFGARRSRWDRARRRARCPRPRSGCRQSHSGIWVSCVPDPERRTPRSGRRRRETRWRAHPALLQEHQPTPRPWTQARRDRLSALALRRDASADSDVVAAGTAERELVHAPRHVLDRRDVQSGCLEPGMPVVPIAGDDVTTRRGSCPGPAPVASTSEGAGESVSDALRDQGRVVRVWASSVGWCRRG